jgi:hypothetical protein
MVLNQPRTQCYSSKENRNASCPVCQDWLNILAMPLPFAHCSQSRLVCSISGLPLNEHNQPMVLPNGYVYGEQVSPIFDDCGVLWFPSIIVVYLFLIFIVENFW